MRWLLAFGDVGKAAAVVVMVIQIAGSGGTYPIETLPEIYQKIYIFFPFPYAINAMRETIGGMYGSDYMKYLGELLLFAVAAASDWSCDPASVCEDQSFCRKAYGRYGNDVGNGRFYGKERKYEQMYEMLVTYERKIHEKESKENQYRFKVYYYYSVDLPVPSVLDREQ